MPRPKVKLCPACKLNEKIPGESYCRPCGCARKTAAYQAKKAAKAEQCQKTSNETA